MSLGDVKAVKVTTRCSFLNVFFKTKSVMACDLEKMFLVFAEVLLFWPFEKG